MILCMHWGFTYIWYEWILHRFSCSSAINWWPLHLGIGRNLRYLSVYMGLQTWACVCIRVLHEHLWVFCWSFTLLLAVWFCKLGCFCNRMLCRSFNIELGVTHWFFSGNWTLCLVSVYSSVYMFKNMGLCLHPGFGWIWVSLNLAFYVLM